MSFHKNNCILCVRIKVNFSVNHKSSLRHKYIQAMKFTTLKTYFYLRIPIIIPCYQSGINVCLRYALKGEKSETIWKVENLDETWMSRN